MATTFEQIAGPHMTSNNENFLRMETMQKFNYLKDALFSSEFEEITQRFNKRVEMEKQEILSEVKKICEEFKGKASQHEGMAAKHEE